CRTLDLGAGSEHRGTYEPVDQLRRRFPGHANAIALDRDRARARGRQFLNGRKGHRYQFLSRGRGSHASAHERAADCTIGYRYSSMTAPSTAIWMSESIDKDDSAASTDAAVARVTGLRGVKSWQQSSSGTARQS